MHLCECGCGKASPIYNQSNKNRGMVKGMPARFLKGHSRWKRKPFETRYNQFLSNNRHRKDTTLTYKQFFEFTKINDCHYCGGPIDWSNTMRYNLDRKDNSKGYSKENVVVCCKLCNYLKADKFTYDEFLIIGHAVRQVVFKRIHG